MFWLWAGLWCWYYCGYVRRFHAAEHPSFTHYPECPKDHPELWDGRSWWPSRLR